MIRLEKLNKFNLDVKYNCNYFISTWSFYIGFYLIEFNSLSI